MYACATLKKSRTTTCGSAALPSTRSASDLEASLEELTNYLAKAYAVLRIIPRRLG